MHIEEGGRLRDRTVSNVGHTHVALGWVIGIAIQPNGDTAINAKTHITATEPDPERHPEKKIVLTTELHRGTDVIKEAKLWEMRSPKTGEHKSFGLTLTSEYESSRPNQSISLQDSKIEDSISALHDFLVAAPKIDTAGEYRVVEVRNNPLGQLADVLRSSSIDSDSIVSLVELLGNPSIAALLSQVASDTMRVAQGFAAAVNYTRMSQRLDEFERLVEHGCGKCTGCKGNNGCLESSFQNFLTENSWIFGSQYSKVTAKKLTFDNDELDFMMRRTADGYEEIVEIKRPKAKLFRARGNKGLAETMEMVNAVNQVENYQASLEADQHKFDSEEHGYLKVEKIRAKIIIGRNSNKLAKKRALRRLNGRFNRIEVITFDQLIANARQMLQWLEREIEDNSARNMSPAQPVQPANDIHF